MTEENKFAHMNITGIKCDAIGCDYNNDDVRYEDYREWLNKPCPKCGANLLTQEAMDACTAMMAACKAINTFGNEMAANGIDLSASPDQTVYFTVDYDEHGKPKGTRILTAEEFAEKKKK